MAMLPHVETARPVSTAVRRGVATRATIVADANPANVTAGTIAIMAYLFGATPLMLGVLATLRLSPAQVSSWFFVTFLTSGVGTVVMSLRYRQPIAIGWSLPALVLIGSVGARYSASDLFGACLVAGVAVLVLGSLGVGERIMHLVPMPLALAMFAGSMLHYVTHIFAHLGAQPFVVGAALAGYLMARWLSRAWLPPVGGAVATGVLAAVVAGETRLESMSWAPPTPAFGAPSFGAEPLLALSLPLVVMVIGAGNAQGIGLLLNQGYRAPVRAITMVVGAASVINAALGGHSAGVQSASGAVLSSADAGPRDGRYVGAVIAGVGCVVIAVMAATAGSLLTVLPASLVVSLAGVAVLRTLMEAFEKTATTDMRLGAFVAFSIAASPLTILGIGPALWALVGGYIVSAVVERPALLSNVRKTGCA